MLLAWYDRHRRHLPWRAAPGEAADPYHVWLSEIMLQQTTVKAVGPYYAKFLARWPDVESLAAAPLDDVLRAWAGLGYYARARNLHACAKAVAGEHGGRFPGNEDELARAARHRRLHRGGDRGHRVRPPRGGDRRQHRAGDRAALRNRSRIAGGEVRNPRPGRDAGAGAARRRFHPGDDGPRRHDLHAEAAGLRHLSMGRCVRGQSPRRRRDVSAQGAEGRRQDALRRIVRGDARRRSRTGPDPAGEGPARRHDRGAFDRLDARLRRNGRAARRRRSRRNGGSFLAWSSTASRIFRCGRSVYVANAPAKTKAPAGMRWVALAELHGEALPNVMRKVATHAGLLTKPR